MKTNAKLYNIRNTFKCKNLETENSRSKYLLYSVSIIFFCHGLREFEKEHSCHILNFSTEYVQNTLRNYRKSRNKESKMYTAQECKSTLDLTTIISYIVYSIKQLRKQTDLWHYF